MEDFTFLFSSIFLELLFSDENPEGHEGGIRISQVPFISHHSNFQAATRAITAALTGTDENVITHNGSQDENAPKVNNDIPNANPVQETENEDTPKEVSTDESETREGTTEVNVDECVKTTTEKQEYCDSKMESDIRGDVVCIKGLDEAQGHEESDMKKITRWVPNSSL